MYGCIYVPDVASNKNRSRIRRTPEMEGSVDYDSLNSILAFCIRSFVYSGMGYTRTVIL